MLTSGQNPVPSFGRNIASTPPSAPPIRSSGARTPPDVPDPSDTLQMTDLTNRVPTITRAGTSPCSNAPMTSYPTPSAWGKTSPPTPTTSPPSAGHHIQWRGSRLKASSAAYTASVRSADSAPASNPTTAQPTSPAGPMNTGCGGTGKSGPSPMM